MSATPTPVIVSREAWLEARKAHLKRERAFTALRDQLLEERRRLPWVRVEQDYVFEGPRGKLSLADLFEGRSELIVYHFMLGPDWDEGCKHCSFLMDQIDGPMLHLRHHDVAFAAVARAPYAKVAEYQRRMGWQFTFVSSAGSTFNFDYHVSFTPEQLAGEIEYNFRKIPGEDAMDELPGLSVFAKDAAGAVYHTYSTYARGLDTFIGAHHLLDVTPRGRNEGRPMSWIRHHDRYETAT